MVSTRRFTPGHAGSLLGALTLLAAPGGPTLAQDAGSSLGPADPVPPAHPPAGATVLDVCRGDLLRPDARRTTLEGASPDGLADGRTNESRSPYATWFVDQLRRSAEQIFVPAAPPPLYAVPDEPEVPAAALDERLEIPTLTRRAWPAPPRVDR